MSNISAKTHICIIIGNPVEHSLSPAMHNAGYETLGIDDQYIFVGARVGEENLEKTVLGLQAMHVKGITVTHPHKVTVMQYLDSIDETAQKIGAVNTIVNNNDKLVGSNTDWVGVVDAIEKVTSLKDKSVALIGAGGAARAAVFGVTKQGAKAKIFNRTIEKAKDLADEFHCEYRGLDALQEVQNMDIIINVTPVSMNDTTIVDKQLLHNRHIVFDAVYSPYETRLLQEAKAKGATIIHGTDWLLYQGLAQFTLYTGHKAPEETMREVLMKHTIKLG